MHALAAVGFTALLVPGCSPASADNTEPKPDAPASNVQKTDAPAAEKSAYVSQPYDPALLEAAYPSGHTSEAYWQGVIMATLLPELSNGILARVSEAGNNRIVMGAHYPTDVIGGRRSRTSRQSDS